MIDQEIWARTQSLVEWQQPFLPVYPHSKTQSARIAQILNKDLGTATITHPFHPLNGKTFTILKIRKLATGRHYSLLADGDVFCVPESWITPIDENHTDNSSFSADVLRLLLDFSHDYQNKQVLTTKDSNDRILV
jgi:hypothetical protein